MWIFVFKSLYNEQFISKYLDQQNAIPIDDTFILHNEICACSWGFAYPFFNMKPNKLKLTKDMFYE